MADKHIIDGIEYEAEPSYVDEATGKPVFYAKDIPAQIRRIGKLTEEDIQRARELDALPHLERLQLGADDWNHWVKVNLERWTEPLNSDRRVAIRWMDHLQVARDWYEIDFHPSREANISQLGASNFSVDTLDASECVFPTNAIFIGGIFRNITQFHKTIFVREVNFTAAKFQGQCSFEQSDFRAQAVFLAAVFMGRASFSNSNFRSYINFEGTRYLDYLEMRRCKIFGTTNISGAEFFSPAYFHEVNFAGRLQTGSNGPYSIAVYLDPRYQLRIPSGGAIFWKNSEWDGCVFEMNVSFDGSQFFAQSSFKEAIFNGAVSFDHVCFGKSEKMFRLPQKQYWNAAEKSEFEKTRVNYSSRIVPDFRGSIFKLSPNLGYTEICEIPYKNDPLGRWWANKKLKNQRSKHKMPSLACLLAISDENAASKLRVVQALAARGHHHLAEKRFFRLELLVRRGHEADSLHEVAMISAFELFSKCGLSFWRPMEWLVRLMALCALAMLVAIQPHLVSMHGDEWIVASLCAGIVLWQPRWGLAGIGLWFFLLYWQAGNWTFGGLSAHTLAQLSIYTGLNSLPVIGLASDGYAVASEYLFGKPDMVPLGVRVLAFIQNAVSAVFIFFGLLAIRNYFKLG